MSDAARNARAAFEIAENSERDERSSTQDARIERL